MGILLIVFNYFLNLLSIIVLECLEKEFVEIKNPDTEISGSSPDRRLGE